MTMHEIQEAFEAPETENESAKIESAAYGDWEAESLRKDEEIARLSDAYLRAVAETENVRNRAKRELEDASRYAATRFARDMVNIVENLSRAVQSIPPEARETHETLKQVAEGLEMTMQELLGIFERNGVRRLDPAGEKFDHNLHQAVAQIESDAQAPGHVVQVLQAGYTLHDRLLRPAMVTVASQPKPAT